MEWTAGPARRRCLIAAAAVAGAMAAPAGAGATLLALSPRDGGNIANDIVVANNNGSARRVVVPNAIEAAARISPNGRLIAMTMIGKTATTIISAATGATVSQRFTSDLCAGWTPDSKALICYLKPPITPQFGFYRIDAATGATTLIAPGTFTGAAISPDGKKIAAIFNLAASGPGQRLEVIDVKTHRVKVLFRGKVEAPVYGPNQIAFSRVTQPKNQSFPSENVWAVKPNGTGLRRLTRFKPIVRQAGGFILYGLLPVAWSRNRILAEAVTQQGVLPFDSWAVDPVKRRYRKISQHLAPQGLSRDGRFVLGETGTNNSFTAHPNVVRVPWTGGRAVILLRNARAASWTQ